MTWTGTVGMRMPGTFSTYNPGPNTCQLCDLEFPSHWYLKFLLCQMGIITIAPTPDRVAVKNELTSSAQNSS